MKRKNGFTLVELAIVLVIIGILIGLAMKGASLIEAATLRAEAAKLSKIKTAISTYITKYDRIPGSYNNAAGVPQNVSSKEVLDALKDEELLSDGDVTTTDDFTWAFIGCNTIDINAATGTKAWTTTAIKSTSGLCAYITTLGLNGAPLANAGTSNVSNPGMGGPLACVIETTMDDGNVYTGSGRFVNGRAPNNGIGAANLRCNDNNIENQVNLEYLYRVR